MRAARALRLRAAGAAGGTYRPLARTGSHAAGRQHALLRAQRGGNNCRDEKHKGKGGTTHGAAAGRKMCEAASLLEKACTC